MPAAVLVAAALDVAWGEPPLRLHPVVWAGRYLTDAGARLPAGPAVRATALGGIAWVIGAASTVAAGVLVRGVASRLPPALGSLVTGVALWPLLSGRMLFAEVAAVESALTVSLEEGRAALARIVSRETGNLSPEEVRAAAIESLAENLSDALVAPLVWYVVAGLPGAALYRFANTADAMWGYRTERWAYAGKVAARADDVLNLAPARLTALLLAGPRPSVLRRLPGQARRTASPNSGWPMAALALLLGVRLPKQGAYVLNPEARLPWPGDLRDALAAARWAGAVAVLAAVVAAGVFSRKQPVHPSQPRGAA